MQLLYDDMANDPTREFARFKDCAGQTFSGWREFIVHFTPRIHREARGFRQLSAADVDDVAQEVWKKFWAKMHTIRDPNAVGKWLATTTQRQAIQRLRDQRCIPMEELRVCEPTDPDPSEQAVVSLEQEAMRRAMRKMNPADRKVLEELVIKGRVDYRKAAEKLRRPVGSLGPTRGRALNRLRLAYIEEHGE